MKAVIVNSKELGNYCWSSFRFIRGLRCPRVFTCNYPEKKLCRAVETELAYLKEHSSQLIKEIKKSSRESIRQLENDLKK